ncbi:hypothetical protein ARMSODRAFT_964588 [Armillaria solidipes]|uniref:Uncharacterized protein n=1 Tax=Armillaria solidipes TaxID=1076256 RepID=A0A2H3B6Y1_9AGAR|nr:hypothetical protein ARMSODRAFT_964588 [Armillaria solidipes]
MSRAGEEVSIIGCIACLFIVRYFACSHSPSLALLVEGIRDDRDKETRFVICSSVVPPVL